MTTTLSEEERFSKNISDLGSFAYLLVEKAYNQGINIVDPNMVSVAMKFLSNLNKITLLHAFIQGSHSHWDKIKVRDELFFVDHAHEIFHGLPTMGVDAFKSLFLAKDSNGKIAISQEDRDVIWKYFESFVKIAIKYIHRKREPYIVRTQENTKQPAYAVDFMSEVKLEHHAKTWNIPLSFGSI